jgi:glucosamine--fructose-6-phosphate aminotransferase (isomerizing)
MSMRSELGEAPDVVATLLDRAVGPVSDVARLVRERDVDLVVIAARGTSDHAAIYAQYVLGARNGLPVALAAPSLTSVYSHSPRVPNALVIGISQSGRSPDVVAVLEDARRQGAVTVALTNDPSSELAGVAARVIELGAGPEHAVAATKTYVAEVALLAMLSAAISGDEASTSELRALPVAMRAALEAEDAIAAIAERWAAEDRCAVLARGFQYATAREWALKLKELAYVLADPYSGADFEHGPIALVEVGFPVLAVATAGPLLADMHRLLARLGAARARLLVLSDDPALRSLGDGIAVPAGVPEWLSPIVTILPAQLFAYHLARARGLDTEAPRTISKITLTR